MSLAAEMYVHLGRFVLDVSLRVDEGEVLALVGPNGAGKTTALFAIAGLVALERGRVALGTTVLEDCNTGIWLPPEAREIGFVFQDARLFPHQSVLENVAFGLRAQRCARAQARARAREWLERVGIGALANARAATLSGGEARKVALARALAIRPRALLLDEPFASLDEEASADVRETLRAHLTDFAGPCVLVTHEPEDARILGDRVLRLESGRSVTERP